MTDWGQLFQIARRQHGVVSVQQAIEAGIPQRSLRQRAASERWPRLHRGVAAVPGSRLTHESYVMAAVLAAGPQAVASHWTAAQLHGIRPGNKPSRIHLIVPAARTPAPLEGVCVARTRTLQPRHVTRIGSLPVTTGPRTICDLAGSVPTAERLRPLVIGSLQSRRATLPKIAMTLREVGRVRGAGLLRSVLAQLDEDRCDSELEFLVRKRLRNEGFEPAPAPVPLLLPGGRTVFIDVGFPPWPVGIEVDGHAYHSSPEARTSDDRRQNAIQATGYRLLRITWLRLDEDWPGFVQELRWNLENASRV